MGANFSQKLHLPLHDFNQWRTKLKKLTSWCKEVGLDEVTVEDIHSCYRDMESSFPTKNCNNWLNN
jgi:hypothetical protein